MSLSVGCQPSTAMDDSELADPELEPSVAVVVPAGKRRRPLANTYAAKKTVAQGMMDVALITANANQMRFVLEYQDPSVKTYYVVLFLIFVSLVLQVAVGVSLIFKGRCDLSGDSKLEQANRINNYVVVGVFLITIINVFIASFSISGGPPEKPLPS